MRILHNSLDIYDIIYVPLGRMYTLFDIQPAVSSFMLDAHLNAAASALPPQRQ